MADAESDIDKTISAHLDRLLQSRAYPKTICPSEVARALSTDDLHGAGWDSWRDAMDRVRQLAWARADVQVLQKGEVKDKDAELRGPVRLRLVNEGA